jgi:mono/diheme cytochrome c family protein
MGAAHAQQTSVTTVKKVPARPIQSLAGKDLYREYCAVCHGIAGKGDGPAAIALKTPPSDLTQISRKNGGKFPRLRVLNTINGESGEPAAHGSKDMPVWGSVFQHMNANSDIGTIRVHNLMEYIEEIQAR